MSSSHRSCLAAVTALFGAAEVGASEKLVSPSKVLAKSDQGMGSQSVPFRYGARDRIEAGDDRSLAPYLYVAGGDPEKERLPLKETRGDVQIAGVIARVKVHQVFSNDGKKAIEAVYVFPASTRAAVHGMRMKIGARTVEAKIDRRQAARENYEAAKAAGKRTSLLEQERENVFTMSVANIMPKDIIEVQLDYSEMLVPEDATYEFVYPTVVGPRYSGGADPGKDQWMSNPHLGEGQPEPYKFGIAVHLETGIPLKEVASPSHKVDVSYAGRNSADVRLAQAGGGNKDFVLRYRLAGDKVETGLLLFQGPAQNGTPAESFFALMMEPPQRPTDAQIPSREYIFLLDVSGSMHGFPLDTAKELMKNLLGQLRPRDHFNLALFSGANYVMAPAGSVPATSENIRKAIDLVLRQTGGGGTELMGGLQASYGIPKKGDGISRTVVVITDGYVGVEAKAFKFIRDRLDEANLFAFGIGSSVNRGLIEGMARAGLGEPFVVLRPDKAKPEAEKLRAYIEKPVLTHIEVKLDGFDAYEVSPSKVPDLMARRPIVVFGKYRGNTGGRIAVSGVTGGGKFMQALDVRAADVRSENAPLRSLWARKWVGALSDNMTIMPSKEVEEAITGLGLQYSLLTAFTSFLAVDSQVVNQGGSGERVRQPLPMPEGVSNSAVGGGESSARASGILGVLKGKAGGAYASPMRAKAPDDAYGAALGGVIGHGSGAGGLGSAGSGAGYGRMGKSASGPVTATPAVPAAQPPPAITTKPTAEASKSEPRARASRRAGVSDERDAEDARGAVHLDVGAAKGLKVVEAALVTSLRGLLARAGCRWYGGGMTLTIDANGRIVSVAIRLANKTLAACFEQAFVGFVVGGAVATGSGPGTVEITVSHNR